MRRLTRAFGCAGAPNEEPQESQVRVLRTTRPDSTIAQRNENQRLVIQSQIAATRAAERREVNRWTQNSPPQQTHTVVARSAVPPLERIMGSATVHDLWSREERRLAEKQLFVGQDNPLAAVQQHIMQMMQAVQPGVVPQSLNAQLSANDANSPTRRSNSLEDGNSACSIDSSVGDVAAMIQRIRDSANRADAINGLEIDDHAATASAIVSISPAALARTLSGWKFPTTLPNVVAFNGFLERFVATDEYRDPRVRQTLHDEVTALIDQLRNVQHLRDHCFELAEGFQYGQATSIRKNLQTIQLAVIDNLARAEGMTDSALFQTGEDHFVEHLIDQLVLKKIQEVIRTNSSVDRIGIKIGYLPVLAKLTNFSDVVIGSNETRELVSQNERGAAENAIKQRLESQKSVEFLAGWQPWRSRMEQKHPTSYALEHDRANRIRDELQTLPPRTSAVEWRNELSQLPERNAQRLHALTVALTNGHLLEQEELEA